MQLAPPVFALTLVACLAASAASTKKPPVAKTAAHDVEVCPGVWADASGNRPAYAALQKCLDSPTFSRKIELPRGTYKINGMLVVKHSGTTITTKGLFGSRQPVADDPRRCAVFKAAPTLDAPAMLYSLENVVRVTLDHVNFDGNRAARQKLAQAMRKVGSGRNVLLVNGDGSRVRYCGFYRTASATALGVNVLYDAPAKNVLVTRCVFADNGSNPVRPGHMVTLASVEADYGDRYGLWADGLTLGVVADSEISHNEFSNNSDVSLILGGGVRTRIHHNIFKQTWQRAFAAFMLTNWTGPGDPKTHKYADFRGMVFSDNKMYLPFHTDIGIVAGVLMVAGGPHVANLRTLGGTFRNNFIETKSQGIHIGGGGTPDAPVVLQNNTIRIAGKHGSAGISRIMNETSPINIQNPGIDSFVSGDIAGATNVNWNSIY